MNDTRAPEITSRALTAMAMADAMQVRSGSPAIVPGRWIHEATERGAVRSVRRSDPKEPEPYCSGCLRHHPAGQCGRVDPEPTDPRWKQVCICGHKRVDHVDQAPEHGEYCTARIWTAPEDRVWGDSRPCPCESFWAPPKQGLPAGMVLSGEAF